MHFGYLRVKGHGWGYSEGIQHTKLPQIRTGVLQPYNILAGYEPSDAVKSQINTAYAQHYTPLTDITLMLKNFKYLGGI